MALTGAPSRRRAAVNLAVFLASVATIGVVANVLASDGRLRLRVDATRTRAYSLSEQTRRLLAGLEGDWRIVLVMGSRGMDQATLRQAEEVLDRYRQASPRIAVERIDPSDPRSLDRYESLLAELRGSYRPRIDEYDAAIAAARRAVQGYGVFLQQQSGALAALRRAAEAESVRQQVDPFLRAMPLRQRQVQQVEAELEKSLRIDESRPVADYEAAVSVLVLAMGQWGQEVQQALRVMTAWRDDAASDPAARQFAGEARGDYEAQVAALVGAADPLKHLPPLELSRIGRSLEAGETAIVSGPPGAAVIPPDQLFARLNPRARAEGDVAFDQRFRGEQAISSAIRSLLAGGKMPVVYLVHGGEEPMLARRSGNLDFSGAADMLRAGRYEVREWNVAGSARPAPPEDRPAVWIVVPPPVTQRRSSAIGEAEQALLNAAAQLIADGQPVLLNLAPSALALTGRSDPWPKVAAPFGIGADTGRVIFESLRDAEGNRVTQPVLQIEDPAGGHPISTAVQGLAASFHLPVALRVEGDAGSGARRDVVVAVPPGEGRWLEDRWTERPDALGEPDASRRFAEALPIVIAAERRNPVRAGAQRLLVVGSGTWLLSALADAAVAVGGDRMVLMNPGNYELLLAGTAWLAGADEMIAASPVSRQVARLEGMSPAALGAWRAGALLLLPMGWMGLGLVIWSVRRR
jgi:hypothetical protein